MKVDLVMPRFLAYCVLAGALALPLTAIGQENLETPVALDSSDLMDGNLEPAPTPGASAEPTEAAGELRRWRLRGGGEVTGRRVKEVSDLVYIDLGPRIVSVPRADIVKAVAVDNGAEEAGEEDFPTPQVALERARRGTVLIRNGRESGSGFVLNREGLILTAYQNVRSEAEHTVTLFRRAEDGAWDRENFRAVPLRAFSATHDLALLQLDTQAVADRGLELTPVPLAIGSTAQLGDRVFAVGAPGARGGVAEGTLSALSRNVDDMVHLEATASPAEEAVGGPLVNERGRALGLLTQRGGGPQGATLAVPVEVIRHFLEHRDAFAFDDHVTSGGIRYLPPN